MGTAFSLIVSTAGIPPVLPDEPPAPHAETVDAPVPDAAILEAKGALIGDVFILAGDVFDPNLPGEDTIAFRLVNRLHRNTREMVIRRQLLFRPGDRFSRRALEESERILRGARYLYGAKIRPVRYEDNRVDVEVATRDVWTLTAGVGFGRSGGVNSTRFGIQDSNFLGTGKDLTLRRTTTVDRTQILYRYRDPNLVGTRGQLELSYSNNSDGRSALLEAGRPFFSLSTRWAAGFAATSDDRVDSLYDLGEIVSRFRHRTTSFRAFAGFSRGFINGRTRRLSAGFAYRKELFETVAGQMTPPVLPPDRTLAYPWMELEVVEDGFITIQDLDKIERTEDVNLGRQYRASLGWSSSAFGGNRDQGVFDASYQRSSSPGTSQLLFVSGRTGGRWGREGRENLVVGGSVRYYLRDLGRHIFYALLRGDATSHLDPERQLLLGGDNGLRGYPLRYLNGDRRLLLTLEQRFYTDWHVWKLFQVGGAVFFDVGRAWFAGGPYSADPGFLKDVGAGLRIGSSRSAKASLIHLDLAFALDAPEGTSRAQFLVTTGETF